MTYPPFYNSHEFMSYQQFYHDLDMTQNLQFYTVTPFLQSTNVLLSFYNSSCNASLSATSVTNTEITALIGNGVCGVKTSTPSLPPSPPPPPSQPPPPSSPPLALQCTSICGDPHLYLAHGGRTDFRGKNSKIYNFLSSHHLSVNVKIEESLFKLGNLTVNGSFMTEVYISALTTKNRWFNISFKTNEINDLTRLVDGSCAKESKNIYFNLLPKRTKVCDDLFIEREYWSIRARFLEWDIGVHAKPIYDHLIGPYHRVDVQFFQKKLYQNFYTPPHGIVGQSFDNNTLPRFGKIDIYPSRKKYENFTTSAMGEGAIDGYAQDYEMYSKYETNFKFSRFESKLLPYGTQNELYFANATENKIIRATEEQMELLNSHEEQRRLLECCAPQ